jgi:hypothetical protein
LQYTLSNIPDKHFWKPLPPLELTKMNAKKVTHTAELLDSLYPQLPAKVRARQSKHCAPIAAKPCEHMCSCSLV